MGRVEWQWEARQDLDRLARFLWERQPGVAARALGVIMEGAALLESFPYLGRSLDDETDRRDWPVNFGSGAYILRYRVDDDGVVVILRVWHSREQRD